MAVDLEKARERVDAYIQTLGDQRIADKETRTRFFWGADSFLAGLPLEARVHPMAVFLAVRLGEGYAQGPELFRQGNGHQGLWSNRDPGSLLPVFIDISGWEDQEQGRAAVEAVLLQIRQQRKYEPSLPKEEILEAVQTQAQGGNHDIRSVAAYQGRKFLNITPLTRPFVKEITWCPTMTTRVDDEIYRYHRIESALILATPTIYSYPEVEQIKIRMMKAGLAIPNPADPKTGRLRLFVDGQYQTVQIDFGVSLVHHNELQKETAGKLNNQGKIGQLHYFHVASIRSGIRSGPSEWFSLDIQEERGSFTDRVVEYWEFLSKVVSTFYQEGTAPKITFSLREGRILDPHLAVLNGARHI